MKETKPVTVKWACPKCGAEAQEHGKGGVSKCMSAPLSCEGLLCECEEDTAVGHGNTLADPCRNANCYHCGWGGTFPRAPKKAAPWEKKALAAGWVPPEQRRKELGL